ncbi:cytochrome P450 [Phaeosphaeriaceae sp. SRC1lsM3a]|nr:cytochrome P450 [Stagonospora sp. SRC1lsM3a]
MKSEPQLPPGNSSTLRSLSESFSFHSSPESFITSRIISFQKENSGLIDSRSIIRAKVLNRDVAIISTHAQIQQVLRDNAANYEASPAYDDLMAPFFPSPNILLSDGKQHQVMLHEWEERMVSFNQKLAPLVRHQVVQHFSEPSSSAIDLYESMKRLSWKIIFKAVLGMEPHDKDFAKMESHQEDLLRGQFSLFPVTINAGFWHSSRKKGKAAKLKLQKQILGRFQNERSACPFATANDGALEDVANHAVLMTSSLAVKALASLLAATMLNLYLYKRADGGTLAQMLANQDDSQARLLRLKSILLESERLSPPIIGIMRRSMQDNIVASRGVQADVIIPKGWDCWLYFVGSGRDPEAFGPTWDTFDPDRYLADGIPEPLAFGSGPKTCLGLGTVREIALNVADACIASDIQLHGHVSAPGVRGWLGWERNDAVRPEDWAQDMKQLPTQRPSEPIMVRVVHGTQ